MFQSFFEIPMQTLAAFSLGPRDSLGAPIHAEDFGEFFTDLKSVGVMFTGICTLACLVLFIISLTKLSASAGNDRARASALKGVLYSGISLALFGGSTVIIGVFWNALS